MVENKLATIALFEEKQIRNKAKQSIASILGRLDLKLEAGKNRIHMSVQKLKRL